MTGAVITLPSRTIAKYLPMLFCRVLGELVLAVAGEREVDGPLAGLVRADLGGGDLVPGEQTAVIRRTWQVDLLALRHLGVAEGHEVQAGRSSRRGSGSGPRSGRPASRR